jgi:DNA phosphorothioation-dependent restriction protein DptG
MGGKCEKSRNERLYRMSEQIFLKSAKLYYKQNEMWVEAKKTEDAIKEMECVARTYFENSKKIEDTTDSFGKTVATSRGGIKENNPGLLEDLQSIL